MLREPKGKTRFLSLIEETKLVERLGPKYGPYARFAILTGLRQREQFFLEWSNVDLEKGLITLPMTKTGETQYIPLNEEAKGSCGLWIHGNDHCGYSRVKIQHDQLTHATL